MIGYLLVIETGQYSDRNWEPQKLFLSKEKAELEVVKLNQVSSYNEIYRDKYYEADRNWEKLNPRPDILAFRDELTRIIYEDWWAKRSKASETYKSNNYKPPHIIKYISKIDGEFYPNICEIEIEE